MTRSNNGDPRVDGLSSRLDGLSGVQETPEDEEEVVRQQREAQLIGVLEADHEQTRKLKTKIVPIASLVLAILVGMLIALFTAIVYDYAWLAGFEESANANIGKMNIPVVIWALFPSLLISITTLTVALLIGVFRSSQGGLLETILTHGGRAAVGSPSGS